MLALVIGGTRNLGPSIVKALLERGYSPSVLNRGVTPDDLPPEVERLRADRTNVKQLRSALHGKNFDLVVDTTLYTGPEAQAMVQLLAGNVGHYIFLSTGQVYLVRLGVERPFKEADYAGPLMVTPPQSNVSDYENWKYGFDKREAEDIFMQAWRERQFPFTSLRLPMVNSERDHYHRIYGYFLRLQDGGPILLPEGPGLPIRHVYGDDVVQAILGCAQNDRAKGKAYNIGQDESVSIDEFLGLLANLAATPLRALRVPRSKLEELGLLPDCSPFSGRWMSALDNSLSKTELRIQYTPLEVYVEKLVRYFLSQPKPVVACYQQRERELALACNHSS